MIISNASNFYDCLGIIISTALIKFWYSKQTRLGLPWLQPLFVDSKKLWVGKLGLLGLTIRYVDIGVFFKVKKLANECSFILLGKVWEIGNLITFSVSLISSYWFNHKEISRALRSYDSSCSYSTAGNLKLGDLLVINKNIIKLRLVFLILHINKSLKGFAVSVLPDII